eukprot:snap_masked-scaffold_25-processed-gene-2.28-mRNA-1 protein AED:1.00 eAED:1.00 QI:0/-1/0/0/-1/1/1/0/61
MNELSLGSIRSQGEYKTSCDNQISKFINLGEYIQAIAIPRKIWKGMSSEMLLIPTEKDLFL